MQDLGDPHIRFLSWVQSILKSDDNYERFRSLYRPPVCTNELAESIFSQFEKVFHAQNSFEKFEFVDPELENDAAEFRKKKGDHTFWETQGFETFKNDIDNILVVDLPKLQTDEAGNLIATSDRPEPYYYILDIDNLIDIDNTKLKGTDSLGEFYYFKTEYIVFRGGEIDTTAGKLRVVYVFDDSYYRVFTRDENDNITFVEEFAHDLTYCPARSFWTTPLNSHSTILKRGPITNSLSELDWYLFFSIAQKYLELYAPFPIYAIYKRKCNYKEEGTKYTCIDGFLEEPGVRQIGANRRKCPKCSTALKVGPGNVLLIDVPRDKSDDPDLMANPMKVIPAERTSLDYVKEALKAKKDEIFENCVGKGNDPINDQAQNELQIQAGFESRTAVLLKIKRNFEIIHHFAIDTVFRLRYGSSYIRGIINYGDKFFVKDESQEGKEYETAVKNGMPEYELATRRKQIDEARYRNNPDVLERLNIMRNLEPFSGISIDKLVEMRAKLPELVTLKDLVIKMQFNSFIDRFEREQASLLLFGRALDFDVRIKRISEVISIYADEYLAAAEEDKPEPEPAPPGPPAPPFPPKPEPQPAE